MQLGEQTTYHGRPCTIVFIHPEKRFITGQYDNGVRESIPLINKARLAHKEINSIKKRNPRTKYS